MLTLTNGLIILGVVILIVAVAYALIKLNVSHDDNGLRRHDEMYRGVITYTQADA